MRAEELFRNIDGHHDEAWADLHAIFRFEISDAGNWSLESDGGKLRARRDSALAADCTIRSNEEDFIRFATGQTNLLTAFMRGEVEISGDPVLLKRFHGMLPRKPRGGSR
jgi:putative sterol carrier protein